MKCDELKVRTVYVDWKGANICYYDPYEVDSAIAELKAENEKQKNEKMYTKLQHDTIIDAMSRSHHKELRATKRALWLARAERAKDRAITCDDFAYLGDTEIEINMTLARTWMKCRLLKPSEWSKVWRKVESKCLAKAEEYK